MDSPLSSRILQELQSPCHYVFNASSGLKAYSYLLTIVNFIFLIGGVGSWIYYRDLPYLKKRNFSLIMVLGLSWLFHILVGPLFFAIGGNESFITSCVFVSVVSSVDLPSFIWPHAVRILSFLANMEYNRLVAAMFAQQDATGLDLFHSSEEERKELLGRSSRLRRLRFFLNARFNVAIALLGLAIASSAASAVSVSVCAETVGNCFVEDDGELGTEIPVIFGGIFAIFLTLLFAVTYKARKGKVPDTFGILREARNAVVIVLFIVTPPLILSLLDVGGFNTADITSFDFSILSDLGVLWFFIYTIPYQVYKAVKFNVVDAEIEVGLKEILESEVGRGLFRHHLVMELSVENLNFYTVAQAFKDSFSDYKQKGEEKEMIAEAKIIYDRFLKETINISAETRNNVKHRLNDPDKYGKVDNEIFEDTKHAIFTLMSRDSFFRFTRGESYKSFLGTASV